MRDDIDLAFQLRSDEGIAIAPAAQRLRLLQHLQIYGRIATTEARERYGIMSPAARVMELRRAGFPIETAWRRVRDSAGVEHRQGDYIWAAS